MVTSRKRSASTGKTGTRHRPARKVRYQFYEGKRTRLKTRYSRREAGATLVPPCRRYWLPAVPGHQKSPHLQAS